MKLRASDPSAMKQFIVGIQSRVNELDLAAASGKSKRVRIFFHIFINAKSIRKRVLICLCSWDV